MWGRIKDFIFKNQIKIVLVLLFIIFIVLFANGKISNSRIIIFVLVLLYIYVYKKIIQYVMKLDPIEIKNEKLLWVLINVDILKLLIINIIRNLYVLLFSLRNWSEAKGNLKLINLVKWVEWLFKMLLINPALFIIYKVYRVIFIYLGMPLKAIFIQRFYGVILSVIILTPLLNYIYELLGNILLCIYILLVIFGVSKEYVAKTLPTWDYNRIQKFLSKHLYKFKLSNDMHLILEYRNSISIFAILI